MSLTHLFVKKSGRKNLGEELRRACETKPQNLNRIRSIVQTYPNAVKAVDKDNWTALHYACWKQAPLKVIQYLVQQWPGSVKAVSKVGSTALHIACRNRAPLEVIRYLVQQWPDAIKAVDKDDMTALHFACESQAPLAVIQCLVEKWPESVQAVTKNDSTALHIACRNQAPLEMIQYLVQKCPDAVKAVSKVGSTALHIACWYQAPLHLIQYLVEQCPEAVEAVDKDGRTPLQMAQSRNASQDVIDCLQSALLDPKRQQPAGNAEMQRRQKEREQQEEKDRQHQREEMEQRRRQQQKEEQRRQQEPQEHLTQQQQPANDVGIMADEELLASIADLQTMVNISNLLPEHQWNDLASLTHHVSNLTQLAYEKDISNLEEQELCAIQQDPQKREFYFSMYETLDCSIAACKDLASGMVAESDKAFRNFLCSTVKDRTWDRLKANASIRNLVAKSIAWAKKQLPIPFIDAAGSVVCALVHVMFSIKEERDKYLGVACVALFAAVAQHQYGTMHLVISRVCRHVIRSGRFVTTNKDYAPWQKWALHMLADPACTRAKAQGRLVAELVLQCIMAAPKEGCSILSVLEGNTSSVALDVAVASAVLEMTCEEVSSLPMLKAPSDNERRAAATQSPSPSAAASAPLLAHGQAVPAVDVEEFHQLKKELADVQTELRKKNDAEKNTKNPAGGSEVDLGNGKVLKTRIPEEEYKYRLERMEAELSATRQQLALLMATQQMDKEETDARLDHVEDGLSMSERRNRKHMKQSRNRGRDKRKSRQLSAPQPPKDL